MKRLTALIITTSLFLAGTMGTLAQQNTVSSAQDTSNKEVPPALRKLVEQYEEQVKSDTTSQENDPAERDFVLNNLVMDETLSKMGRDFYNFFYDNWDPPKTEQSFTIYIREMPSPGMGNMIQVKINYDEIFRQRISPKQEYIKQLARMAVKQSENYIANYEEIQQQLGGEDMEGTGIY
jgi:curli production assembly/transport component CsgE